MVLTSGEDESPGIFTIMKIGYTFDGQFDPNHDDFSLCCKKCHIHKAMISTAITTVILGVFSLITSFFGPFDSLQFLSNLVYLIAAIILVISVIIWKKFYKFIKIYLYFLIVEIFAYFGYLIYITVCIILLSEESADKLPQSIRLAEQLSMLVLFLYLTLTTLFRAWALYCCYLEYTYLKGKVKNEIY